ncbi:type IV toxin-antitoxin system AbiEi family antitoxin domain-containing protein [Leucobacter sp. BZR 635]
MQARELRRCGLSERDITQSLRSGALVRLRQGWYARGSFWNDARPETRHLAAILAAQRAAASPPVFSHLSAAVLLDLPVLSAWLWATHGAAARPDDRTVHVTLPLGSRASSGKTLIRHRGTLSPTDVLSRAGLQHTGPERTLNDLARSVPFEVALSAGDAHLRAAARFGRHANPQAVSAWRQGMHARATRHRNRPGNRSVRALATLAHPLADSPLESVSRLRFAQLGIGVTMQVPVAARGRGSLYLDFLLDGLGIWGEADGKHKYVDAKLRGGRSPEEVLYAEKQRTEWIAGTTGLRVVRWGVAEVTTLERFAAHLRAHRVPFPGSPSAAWVPPVREFLRNLP